MSEFLELEARDGVRMTWNVIPGTKQDAASCVVPVSAMYTPLNPNPAIPVLPYAPLRCRICRSILNPFSVADFGSKMWLCPFCFQRNHFPQQYSAVSQSNLPTELYPECCTVEYMAAAEAGPVSPPVFLFVVDTCMIEEEIGYLKSALAQAVELLPDHSLVGFITFGTYVQVHELGFGLLPKSHVFKGTKEIKKDQILEQMGFLTGKTKPTTGVIAGARDGVSAESIARFLLPASECEFILNSLIEELQKDPWPVSADQRASRCTGAALSVAASLLGICVPGSGGRIMAFIGGPSTEGPGSIISKPLSDPIRSHKDLDKGSAPLYNKAVKFYEEIGSQLVHQGHVLDLFACALDQVGVAEMKVAVERTGGIVVLAESFGHSVFKDSLRRIFQSSDSDLGLSFNGIFEINCSKDVKIQGIIGPCTSLEKKGPLSSDTVVGQGNTSAWKMCGLDRKTSLCVVFDMAKKDAPDAIGQSQNNLFYFQFLTYYQHHDGQMRLRSTTISRRWVAGSGSVQELITGFDQEAAAAVMARLVSFKMEAEVFNNSPDETAYFRMMLNRENVANAVVMIQPSLISYSFQSGPEPVLLDVSAIAGDRILLLDSYFTVVIFHGITIAQWRKAGYQHQEGHEVFAQLLQAPQEEADSIIKERFPVPRLVVCDQYGSQARFLLAKLNPSVTYDSDTPPPPGGDMIFTDDASFQVFMEHLQRLAVQ
ncbi:unnamed protein product [Triticum turgidum subsp. durum]|uniref:Protein transport protein SEC23 n=1 Tax=Triticum turgidum subsp. durum TaxID=4567 RepID=A0A9R0SFD5_TRITD|nr:unnamed protein product [Triticum turgidum subsp. durum]